jgi:hypothetical protein
MNLRRYGLVAIAVAVVVGIVVYLVVFFGTQPTAVRHSGGLTVPGNTVTFAAFDLGRAGPRVWVLRGQHDLAPPSAPTVVSFPHAIGYGLTVPTAIRQPS